MDQVFLARHGQTEWNLQRRRQGQLDSPLTSLGVQQAQRNADLLRPFSPDLVFTSPLGRARATAEIYAETLGVVVVVVDELAEVHHGDFAGLTDDEIEAAFPGELGRRAADKYQWRFPAGESYADADRRAAVALERIEAGQARLPVVVAHEMIGRMLRRRLLGLDVDAALAARHPHDVVYRIDLAAGALTGLSTGSEPDLRYPGSL